MADPNPHPLPAPLGCSDHYCVWRPPSQSGGMGTNGGCHCLPLRMQPGERSALRAQIRWMVAEVERLTAELAAARANPSMASNGCEPAAVVGVELVWLESAGWHLCKPDSLHAGDAPYSAWAASKMAVSFWDLGAGSDAGKVCPDLPAACRQIADRARADGYRVPPHPLGWDVGGDS